MTLKFNGIEIQWGTQPSSGVILVAPRMARLFWKQIAAWKHWVESKGKRGEKPPRELVCAPLSRSEF